VRIETKNELYLHGHAFEPKFLVDDGDAQDGFRPRGFFCMPLANRELPVYSFGMFAMRDVERFHERLHELLGNTCQGRPNQQSRYKGRDGFYGKLVREEINCWDTPLIDVDAVEVRHEIDDHVGQPIPLIVALVEYKKPGEHMSRFQAGMIAGWKRAGGLYLIEERA
jgi:hypothetical protein